MSTNSPTAVCLVGFPQVLRTIADGKKHGLKRQEAGSLAVYPRTTTGRKCRVVLAPANLEVTTHRFIWRDATEEAVSELSVRANKLRTACRCAGHAGLLPSCFQQKQQVTQELRVNTYSERDGSHESHACTSWQHALDWSRTLLLCKSA